MIVHFKVFWVILLCVFTFWVSYCDVFTISE